MRKRQLTTGVSALVLGAGAAVLVISAVFADGFPARHVDLNDGGIWVTSDANGLFGRLNKPAGQLDTAFYPPGGAAVSPQLDVVQDGGAVAAWDKSTGQLYAVDVTRGVPVSAQAGQGTPVPGSFQLGLAGGTVAALDPETGSVWAGRIDTSAAAMSLAALDPAGHAIASVGATGVTDAHAALAVGVDGTVYAVAAGGRTVTLHPDGAGFSAPSYGQLPTQVRSVEVTAVGDRMVAFDPTTGTLVLPGGRTATVTGADAAAQLQVAGALAGSVLVATRTALLSVDLGSGTVGTLGSGDTGDPAAPVRLDNCVHAAWAGASGGYLRSCDGAPATTGGLDTGQPLVQPVFRVNRDSIVLNDLQTGAVWDLSEQRRVDDWLAAKPPPTPKPNATRTSNPDPGTVGQNQPPKARPDDWGARPGRTTLLHVLDNDSDPSGDILSITDVKLLDTSSDCQLAISPDGQTVAITVPKPGPPVHFQYTVDDGKLSATATVTVEIRLPSQNDPPKLRDGYKERAWTVPAGRRLALPVLSDWRDFDGDPVTLAGATAKAGAATTTPDGIVGYLAPLTGGPQTVDYTVTDGVTTAGTKVQQVPGSVAVTVQPPNATTPVAPVTLPDAARGQVGEPITVRPLDNDLPGSDPLDSTATLTLASNVTGPPGTHVQTDLKQGTVTVRADRPGYYPMTYTAAFGNAPFSSSTIRVDVLPAPTSPKPPVAMPDSVVLQRQVPATVDVLANDFDPSGGLLVVQRAAPADPNANLAVAIIGGRWLRITATDVTASPTPQVVNYTISDGVTSPVSGEVTVTELATTVASQPVLNDDYATVRAGDSVTVPVLDNDTDAAGTPLELADQVSGPDAPPAGEFAAVSDDTGRPAGTAYVAGRLVRYIPPAKVTAPTPVTVTYVVEDADLNQYDGALHVTVEPAPSATNPDHPPTPVPVEARAVAGQTIVIPVQTTGVDPDGDSVTVTGMATGPSLGRVLGFNATSITYQSYPTGAGTDQFDYLVTDAYGQVGEATIRVGVTPPGDPQPPVAVDDAVTAAPGAHVHVDVLSNDLIAPGDTVTVTSVKPADGVTAALTGPKGPVTVTAGPKGSSSVVTYTISDGLDSDRGTLTVTSQKDYDAPPVALDAYPTAAPGATSVTVNVLAYCDDPDGDQADLHIGQVFGTGATIAGDSVTIPLAAGPQTVAYQVVDPQGATAVGLIHVPPLAATLPYAIPGVTLTVPRGGSKTVPLTDFVKDPGGKPVRLTTTDEISASPASGITATSHGTTDVVLTAHGTYSGPAALTVEVTDGSSITDKSVVLTVPVQVGPATPVLFCPTDPIPVVEGGKPVALDVTSLCHVWVADPATLPTLRYSADWAQQAPGDVSLGVTDGRHVTVTGGSASRPGSKATITVGVVGSSAKPATLTVMVVAADPPSFTPIVRKDVIAGSTVTVNVGDAVSSALANPVVTVTAADPDPAESPTLQGYATASYQKDQVVITTKSNAKGTLGFIVAVTDVPGRPDRAVSGRITVHLLGKPDAPAKPVPARTLLSHQVKLSWSAPDNNGAPITSYTVSWTSTVGNGTQQCGASPCMINLPKNGVPYRFRVAATNVAGTGPQSDVSDPAEPDAVPTAVTGLAVSRPQDGTLVLTWQKPVFDGSAVQTYAITWSGGGTGTTTATTYTAKGLNNDAVTTFTVTAVNKAGAGPAAKTQGQSAGAPPQPPAPTFTSVNSADSSTRAVRIQWPAVDPNGPAPTTYTLVRTGGSGPKTVCADVTATSCPDDGLANDGVIYTYSLTAANAEPGAGHTSPASPGMKLEASATPDPVVIQSLTATGADGKATVVFDAPPSHGATSTVTCTAGGSSCGTWSGLDPNGQKGVSRTITGLSNGVDTTVVLQDCNGSQGLAGSGTPCDGQVSKDVTTYGPIGTFQVTHSVNGTVVTFHVAIDPNGKSLNVDVQTSAQHPADFQTGVGSGTWDFSDNIGYGKTDNISVTISDGVRPTQNRTDSASTPPPPPPPPSVTVSRGALCGYGTEPACPGGTCFTASCGHVHVVTANFSGNVNCYFADSAGQWAGPERYGPNDSHDAMANFGYPGQTITVTCSGNGSASGSYVWP